MKKHKSWTPEQIELLREMYPICSTDELMMLFPEKSAIAITGKAKVLKIKKKNTPFRFTQRQIEELKHRYPTTRVQDLADEFGCSEILVQRKAGKLGIKKDKEFVRKMARDAIINNPEHNGRKAWIKKGSIPPNKGKKMSEFMSPERLEIFKKNQFKKGNRPHNAVPINTEVFMPQHGYTKVKVGEPDKWELKHRLVWMQHNGPIPEGFNVQFKDGNTLNFEPANLYIVDKSGNMQENTIMRYPDNLRTAIRQIGKLTKTIKEHEKNGY